MTANEKSQKSTTPLSLARRIVSKLLHFRESTILFPMIVFAIVVQTINPVFLSPINVINVLRSTSFTLITAVGMTFVLIAGGLDLSVGSVLALGGVTASLAATSGLPTSVSVIIGMATGLLVGLLNGAIIVKFRIPSLIMTLGTLYMARGAVYIITEGVPVYPLPQAFMNLEQTRLLGIPVVAFVAVGIALIGAVLSQRTNIGRAIYAVGGNREAARLSGINPARINLFVYASTGALAGLTGVMMAARLGSAQAGAGTGFELQVIPAVIIGGTSMFGGSGTIFGTVLGALLISILSNSMTIMRISVYWQNLVIGAILVLAVIIDQYSRERRLGS